MTLIAVADHRETDARVVIARESQPCRRFRGEGTAEQT